MLNEYDYLITFFRELRLWLSNMIVLSNTDYLRKLNE